MFFIAAMVAFQQSMYSVREDNRYVQIEVSLSNPSSTSITVELFGSDRSATGDIYIYIYIYYIYIYYIDN